MPLFSIPFLLRRFPIEGGLTSAAPSHSNIISRSAKSEFEQRRVCCCFSVDMICSMYAISEKVKNTKWKIIYFLQRSFFSQDNCWQIGFNCIPKKYTNVAVIQQRWLHRTSALYSEYEMSIYSSNTKQIFPASGCFRIFQNIRIVIQSCSNVYPVHETAAQLKHILCMGIRYWVSDTLPYEE